MARIVNDDLAEVTVHHRECGETVAFSLADWRSSDASFENQPGFVCQSCSGFVHYPFRSLPRTWQDSIAQQDEEAAREARG